MDKNKECKIVQDLLPNYIENLTSDETNEFIETHLENCEDCTKVLNNMKKDIEVNVPKKDEREVKYIEKYNKKMKRLTITLIVILLAIIIVGGILAFLTIRYNIVLKNFEKYINNVALSQNVYYSDKLQDSDENSIEIYYLSNFDYTDFSELYIQNDKITYFTEDGQISLDTENKLILYEGDYITYTVYSTMYYNSSSDVLLQIVNDIAYRKASSVIESVSFGRFENQFCYILKCGTGWIYLDMDYAPIGFVTSDGGIYTCEFKFNEVTEEDVELPDVSEYVKLEEEDY